MNQRRLLITGATGMVGTQLARKAGEAGYAIRALVRPQSRRDPLADLGVEFFEADLAKPETLAPAFNDVDLVVHAAAHVGDWGQAETYRAVNVYALEHMLSAAQLSGTLLRWIQISSLGIYPPRHHFGTDESIPADAEGLDGYTRTKAEAEAVLRRYVERYDFPAVILRPGFIYGPGDRHVMPTIIERLAAGKMRIIGSGENLLNNTYVGNLIDAILLALQEDAALGETFNIRDDRLVTRKEFVGTIVQAMGLPMPPSVPEWLARCAVVPIEGWARWTGAQQAPLLTRARIKFLTLNLDFSIGKAKQLLGYRPQVDFREGMAEALQWAAQKGLLPPAHHAGTAPPA